MSSTRPRRPHAWRLAATLLALATAASCQGGSVNDLYRFSATKQVKVQVSVNLVAGTGGAAIDPAASSRFVLRAFAADSNQLPVALALPGQTPVPELPVTLNGPSLSFPAVAAVPAAMQPGPSGYALHFQLSPAGADNALVAADGSQLEALLGGVLAGTDASANPVYLSLASTLAVQVLGAQGAALSSAGALAAYAQLAALLEARQTAIEVNVDTSAKVSLGTFAGAVMAALQSAVSTDVAFQAKLAAVAVGTGEPAATAGQSSSGGASGGASAGGSTSAGAGAAGSTSASALAGFAAAITAWGSAAAAVFARAGQGPAVVFRAPYVAATHQAAGQATPAAALAPSAVAFTDTDPGLTVGGTVAVTPAATAAGVSGYAIYFGGVALADGRLHRAGVATPTLVLAAGTAVPQGASHLWAFPIVAGGELAAGASVAIANRVDVPGAPTMLTAHGGNGVALLSWATVVGASGYNVYRSTQLPVVASGCSPEPALGSQFVDHGLTNGTTYYYAVAALNGSVVGPLSTPARVVPAAPLPPPEGLGRSVADGQVTVTWSPNPAASGYNLYRSTTQPATRANATLLADVQSPYVDSGLANNTTYFYALTLLNHDTEGPDGGFEPAMPYLSDTVPTHLSMVNGAGGAAVGAWQAVPRALSYNLYSSGTLPVTTSSAKHTTQALTFTTGITSNLCYYALSATFADGEGPLSAPVALDQRTVAIANGYPANYVFGQPVFNSTVYGGSSQVIMGPTAGIAVSPQGGLLLTDGASNRVMGFSAIPTTNGPTPNFVLGQAGLADINVASGGAANQFSRPQGIYADATSVWVVDRMVAIPGFPPGQPDTPGQPGRVVGFVPLPSGNAPAASVVLGAPDFNWPAQAPSASARTFVSASHVTGGGGRLVVTDQGGNRVLVYNSRPKFSNTPADLVLGQTDFAGSDAHAGAVGAATLSAPSSAWTDGVRLLIYDSGNNRVLLWNTFPTQNGQPADVVLGQPDMAHGAINAGGAVGAVGLANGQSLGSAPGVWSNGTQIAVADPDNYRVLIWDAFPTANGAAATRVLGQASLQANASSPPRNNTLLSPQAVYIDGRYVIVGDRGNERYMVWDAQNP